MGIRFVLYMVSGVFSEMTFYAFRVFLTVKPRDYHLPAKTFLWMYPVYGSLVFIFEPIHNAIRLWPWWGRGVAYVIGCFVVEYVAGWIIKRITGKIPWDYSYSRLHLHGLIRWDYTPVWLAFGFILERLHDAFIATGPVLLRALVGG